MFVSRLFGLTLVLTITVTQVFVSRLVASETSNVADSTPFLSLKKVDGSISSPDYCYLRLNIEPKWQFGSNQTVIDHKKRWGVKRFFSSVDYSFTSVLKVEAADYEESIILYSRKYRSSRGEGENHDRAMLVRGSDYPVFLLGRDANGEARVSVSADMKNAQTFNVAGSALEAVSAGLKAVSPTANIVTALTSESTRAIAQKIDSTAGAFSGATGSNSEGLDLNIQKGESLEVSVHGPMDEVNENNTSYVLGRWTVSFQPEFGSYFFQGTKCLDADYVSAWQKRGSKRDLLSTQLVQNVAEVGTLAAYLKQLDSWTDSVAAMKGKTENSPEVSRFCRLIVDSVTNLGLNTLDGYLTADAVARSSLVGKPEGDAMLKTNSCDFTKRLGQAA